jgi:hypothetical protein
MPVKATPMKSFLITGLRPCLIAGSLLLSVAASARTAIAPDPRDPKAYRAKSYQKTGSNLPQLLSVVNYISQDNKLTPHDSSWITYDAAGHVTEQIEFRWSVDNWIPYDRFSYQFDSQGLNDQTTYYFWNGAANNFSQLARYNYQHDAAGFPILLYYEVWSVSKAMYIPGLMENYTLGANGQRTMIYQQTWNKADEAWEDNTKEQMAYNSQGNLQFYEVEAWNGTLAVWRKLRQRNITYNTSGKLPVLDEEYVWSNAVTNWVYKSRTTGTVSGSNLGSTVFESYDAQNAVFQTQSRESMTYNSHGDLSTSIAATYVSASTFQDVTRRNFTYTPDFQLKTVQTMVQDKGKWAIGDGAGLTTYYYKGDKQVTPLGAGSISVSGPSLLIAPVPASTTLNLSLSNAVNGTYGITISDAAGRSLSRRELDVSGAVTTQMDVSQLPAGLYILSLQQPTGETVSRRFSIAR